MSGVKSLFLIQLVSTPPLCGQIKYSEVLLRMHKKGQAVNAKNTFERLSLKTRIDILDNVIKEYPKVYIRGTVMHSVNTCIYENAYAYAPPSEFIQVTLTPEVYSSTLGQLGCNCWTEEHTRVYYAHLVKDKTVSLLHEARTVSENTSEYFALLHKMYERNLYMNFKTWSLIGVSEATSKGWKKEDADTIKTAWYESMQTLLSPYVSSISTKEVYVYVATNATRHIKHKLGRKQKHIHILQPQTVEHTNAVLLKGATKHLQHKGLPTLPTFEHPFLEEVEETLVALLKDGLTPVQALTVSLSLAKRLV